MPWCFSMVNGRLAEIFFECDKKDKPKIVGHCYVRREEYETKREQRMIDVDITRARVVFRHKTYRLIRLGDEEKNPSTNAC